MNAATTAIAAIVFNIVLKSSEVFSLLADQCITRTAKLSH